jgi:predicted aconitase with swiveling domain
MLIAVNSDQCNCIVKWLIRGVVDFVADGSPGIVLGGTPRLLLLRYASAPAAILTTGVDSFLALASIIAHELYGKSIPLVALGADDFATRQTGDRIAVGEDGSVTRIGAR